MTYYGFKHKGKIIKPGTLLKMGDATDPDPNKYIYHIMYINAFVIKKSTPEDPEEDLKYRFKCYNLNKSKIDFVEKYKTLNKDRRFKFKRISSLPK